MQLDQASNDQLNQWEQELTAEYQALVEKSLTLDLTRGKPSAEQLSLSNSLDGILEGNYLTADGVDTRNYGGVEGIREARELGAAVLELEVSQVFAQGNSSLSMMYLAADTAMQFGLSGGPESAWNKQGTIKFICPCPGYDRHFTVCEQLGIEMVVVPMLETGPDMDAVEALIKSDSSVRGMWCVPKYSNPTGVTYSDETVERIAALGKIAHPSFRVFWDNAYSVHTLEGTTDKLMPIMAACQKAGTEDLVIQFASTSKITHAGAGVAFIGGSEANLAAIKKPLSSLTIGPDKVNQLRHSKLIPDFETLQNHMQKHAAILKPRFDCVLAKLNQAFGDSELCRWDTPTGGYFVSVDTQDGCAKEVIRLAGEAGVKLTPAGATFPYGNDPQDSNIRLAPSVPSLEEVDAAMDVFITCVKLVSVRQKLKN